MKNSKGFTVVEIVMALVVLGIAIGLTWPVVTTLQKKWAKPPMVETLQPAARRVWYKPTAAPPAAPAASADYKTFKKGVDTFVESFCIGAQKTGTARGQLLLAHKEEIRTVVARYLNENPAAAALLAKDARLATASEIDAGLSVALSITQEISKQPWFK